MLFIHPMWDNESERIGKQKCTPIGYALHTLAELLGFLGLLSIPCALVWGGYRKIVDGSCPSLGWVFLGIFGIGLISEIIFQVSWALARRRGFQYDPASCIASWVENGKRITYKYERNKNEH